MSTTPGYPLEKGQIPWLDEVLTILIDWFDNRAKIFDISDRPDAQVNLENWFALFGWKLQTGTRSNLR